MRDECERDDDDCSDDNDCRADDDCGDDNDCREDNDCRGDDDCGGDNDCSGDNDCGGDNDCSGDRWRRRGSRRRPRMSAPIAFPPRECASGERVGVLHVVDCLNVGGTERQLFELLRRLDRRRFRLMIACFKSGGELLPRLLELGLTPIEFPLRGSLAQPNTAYQIARMALLCRRENLRIVHAHDFYSNVIGVAAAELAGARSIASRRDLAHWLSPSKRRALRFACRVADLVIANAGAVAEQSRRELGVTVDKLRIVPNGIDVASFDEQARRAPDSPLPDAPPGRPRIAMVASMHLPDKGHADLLAAAAQLKRAGTRAQWLLVSDGALRPALEAHARALGLDDDVHFLGRRHDVPSILSRCDLVAHPSWAEGFPNAVLEAMCAARPVVATRVGGVPEVMVPDETGLLIEPRKPAALAAALARLITNPLAAHVMGLRARQRVESAYSLDQMCRTVENLYRSLAHGAPRAPQLPSIHAAGA
jgi:glycosyltransferase involved in cell wall biosynthesis